MDLAKIAKKRYRNPPIIRKNYRYKLNLINGIVGSGNLVLELGSGSGNLTRLVEQKNDVVTVDLQGANLTVDLQAGKLPCLTQSFDIVTAIEVLEHILDVDRLLTDIHRVLKPGGRLILSTPNLASLGRRVLLVAGKTPYVENFLYPGEAGHLKHYTFSDVRYLLGKNRFHVEKLTGDVVVLPGWQSGILARIFPHFSRSIIAVATRG
jgi:2-polyprenyl-3-methyl-5-hydroxy-6-metoxy-1,4-benzoquinol methylase